MTDEYTTCPAKECDREISSYDRDLMAGHLLVDHRWSLESATEWVTEHMADG